MKALVFHPQEQERRQTTGARYSAGPWLGGWGEVKLNSGARC